MKFNSEFLPPSEREDHQPEVEERIAIMIIDGGLSEAEAVRIADHEQSQHAEQR